MKIKVIMLEPMKKAYVTEIGNDIRSLQEAVGGNIEIIYPFEEDNLCLVCNEEGKINGLQLNRTIMDNNGNLIDIIAGKAFICDCSGENLKGLAFNDTEKYLKRYQYPEKFVSCGNDFMVLPMC